MPLNRQALSFSLLLLLGFIWGTGYSIARFAMTHGVSPLGYSFWQSVGPAILLTALMLWQRPTQPKLSISDLRYYFICGLTGIVIPNTNMYFAAPHLPAGLLAVIVNTVPIMTYPMAMLAGRESFSVTRLSGVLAAFFGLMLIVLPKTSLPSPGLSPWVLSSLITPLSFAFCAVYISRFRPAQMGSFQSAAGTLLASSLLLAPFVFFGHHFYSLHFPLTLPDKIILLEILLSSIGYILVFRLIKIAGSVYYSLVDTIVALTGLMWGYIIFHEQLNEWTAAAVLLILAALILVNKRQKELAYVKTSLT